MKTPSGELFNLVKSLDTQEKVYLNKNIANRGGSAAYSFMVDIIDKMKKYNEDQLKKELKNLIEVNDFKSLKRRTYDSILKSLSDYHSESSTARILQNLIYQAEILLQKKLPVAAKKIITKAENMSIRTGEYDYLLIILNQKINYWRKERSTENLDEYYNKGGFEREMQYTKEIAKTIQLTKLAVKLERISFRYSNLRNDQFLKKVKAISISPLLADPNDYRSNNALTLFYYIHFNLSHITNKFDGKAYARQKELVKYLETEAGLLVYRGWSYISALSNLMVIQAALKNKKHELIQTFEKAREFYLSLNTKQRTNSIKGLFGGLFANYIGQLADLGFPEEAIQIWEKNMPKADIAIDKLRTSTLIILYGNLFTCYFVLERYHDALKCLNNITNDRSSQRLDIQSIAKIFAMAVHYELRNYELLPYMVKQAGHYLKKHQLLKEFERTMLHFFGKTAPIIKHGKEMKTAFTELKKRIMQVARDPIESKALDFFDFISWMDSKIESKSFVKIVSEKAKLAGN